MENMAFSYLLFSLFCVLSLCTKNQLGTKHFLRVFGVDLVDPWVLQLKEKGALLPGSLEVRPDFWSASKSNMSSHMNRRGWKGRFLGIWLRNCCLICILIYLVEHANLATTHSNGSLQLRNFKIYTKGINSQMSKLLCLQKNYTHIHSSLS